MKNVLFVAGLLAISILYLFEVDYSHVTTLNWIAFGIILITVIYVSASIALSRERRRVAKAERRRGQNSGARPDGSSDQPA